MKAFVLASGPSMTQEQADAVRGRGFVVAVSDAVRLAPWADALVSTDREWWAHHRDSLRGFTGQRFSAVEVPDAGRVPDVARDVNSGLLATKVAVAAGATTVVLLGIDLQGSHFFGEHPAPLLKTSESQFRSMNQCFRQYQPTGVVIINCSPNSMLDAYPHGRLKDWL